MGNTSHQSPKALIEPYKKASNLMIGNLLLQIERAHKILRVLRGPRWNVTKELTDIKVALEGRETYHVRIRDFASATVWKPFLIALSLMFFFQFSGINVILQYTVDIFKSADSSVWRPGSVQTDCALSSFR